MFPSEVTIVDPAAEDDAPRSVLAPGVATLAGAHVGLIDNAKHMAEETLHEIAALLRERYGVGAITHYRKSNASVPTPPEVLRDLASKCDALVHGVAD